MGARLSRRSKGHRALTVLAALVLCRCSAIATSPSSPLADGGAGLDGSPDGGDLEDGNGGRDGMTCGANTHQCNGSCLPNSDDPSADPCVVSDATGVFVAPAPLGAVGAAGTMAAPLSTVGEGMSLARTGKRRVYVCVGKYVESMSRTAADDGLTVYGGLDCANGWKYVGNGGATATTVATPANTPAPATTLTVTGPMTSGMVFEDIEFTSLDGVNPGDSSVTVFATASAIVTLTRCTVTAGKGVTAAGGGTTSNWTGSAPTGNVPVGGKGGLGGSNVCLDGTTFSTRGTGGSMSIPSFGTAGTSVPPVAMPAENGGNSDNPGAVGVAAGAQSQSGAGATSAGTITASGWVNDSGGSGSDGFPGQGGGGGGDDILVNQGGGGGSGGCGGGKGAGGPPGGSSIAILLFQSSFQSSGSVVLTSAAGAGGRGGPGQAGQSGAVGATGGADMVYNGGSGGRGSAGTGGGGGAGGNSIGIAWLGTTGPTVNGAIITADQPTATGITTGAKGSGAAGGNDGNGNASGGAGTNGSANAIQQFH